MVKVKMMNVEMMNEEHVLVTRMDVQWMKKKVVF